MLSKSLVLAEEMVRTGERRPATILQAMEERIRAVPITRIDYVSLVEPETMEPVEEIRGPTLAALAVVIGQTRLIDNCLLTPESQISNLKSQISNLKSQISNPKSQDPRPKT